MLGMKNYRRKPEEEADDEQDIPTPHATKLKAEGVNVSCHFQFRYQVMMGWACKSQARVGILLVPLQIIIH